MHKMASFSSVATVFLLLCMSSADVQTKENQHNNQPPVIKSIQGTTCILHSFHEYPKDCRDVQRRCSTSSSSGVYLIKPDGYKEAFEVFCNNDVDGGGWTVIQRRIDGSVQFNRSWSEHQDGFGSFSTEFWLGNQKITFLTNQAVYELRVDMELSNGVVVYTSYKAFRITDEFGNYSIANVGPFDSNVGSQISACPSNMIYNPCICQATCADPNGQSGCNSDCLGSEDCICPDEFLMNGSDCIPASQCGCFLAEANLVIPNDDNYVSDQCTRRCSCRNNQLICEDDYSCTTDALCGIQNGVRQCYCNQGYEGDRNSCDPLYEDCQDVYDAGHRQDGVFTILPSGWPGSSFSVYCKMDHGGGWTVFQRRSDGVTSFYHNWVSYKDGFGDLNSDFWLGNDKLHYLTNQKNHKLRFDITTRDGTHKYAEYTEFEIMSEVDNYRMSELGDHIGNTGIYFRNNIGKEFSTYDRDNDACDRYDCAELNRSGWWHSDFWCRCYQHDGSRCHDFQFSHDCYAKCTTDNLNGDYSGGNGGNIFTYDASTSYCNLQFVEMKIRPTL